jgi:hypothetical protein
VMVMYPRASKDEDRGVGWVFLFVSSINWVLDQIYAYMLTGSYFLKNLKPPPLLLGIF